MANQQLVDYIKSQLKAGVTKQDLQKAVTTAGWSMQDSNEAFLAAEGKAPATPSAAPMAAQGTARAPSEASAKDGRPAVSVPRMAAQQIETSPRRSLTWVWVFVVAVVVVAAAAAAYLWVPAVSDIVNFYLSGGSVSVPAPVVEQPAPIATTTEVMASSSPEQASTTPDSSGSSTPQ